MINTWSKKKPVCLSKKKCKKATESFRNPDSINLLVVLLIIPISHFEM